MSSPAPTAVGATVNVCSGHSYSLREVIAMAEHITGHALPVQVNPAFVRANEVKTLLGNPARLRSGEAGGLHRVGAGPLDRGRAPVTLGHQAGQQRERLSRPRRHRLPRAHRGADHQPEPVDEPAQRSRHVGIRRSHGGVLLLLRRPAVEGRIARSPEERGRLVDEREVARVMTVQAAQEAKPVN